MRNQFIPVVSALAVTGLLVGACAPSSPGAIKMSALPRNMDPGVPAASLRGFADANNAFALGLYENLRVQDGNLAFSPYSISSALAMTYAGARGETEAQMAKALHFDLPQADLHGSFNQLDLVLAPGSSSATSGELPFTLRIANAVWIEQTLKLLDEYLDVLARNYGAGVRTADFVNAFEAARRDINAWVRQQTEKRIEQLIPAGALDNTTKMVLVNAIYFKADWLFQFEANETTAGAFHLLDGSEVETQMMRNDLASVGYASLPGYEVVELPYVGETTVMDVLVPAPGTFEDFDARLDAGVLAESTAGLQPSSLHLEMPKFTYRSAFDLKESLSALGMPSAFDPYAADFSGMTGGRDLYISKALHQAFVAVDEQGTEAAAATAVIVGPTSIMLPDKALVVDRPFIFLIRNLETQQILFVGRVVDPTQ